MNRWTLLSLVTYLVASLIACVLYYLTAHYLQAVAFAFTAGVAFAYVLVGTLLRKEDARS